MSFIKKVVFNTVFKLFWLFNIIGLAITALAFSISKRFDLMGWTNSITFAAVLLIALLWMLFANSKGVFDMMTVGVKNFWGGFRKDYKRIDYFEYRQSRDPVNKNVYIALGLSTSLFIIASIILFILVKK